MTMTSIRPQTQFAPHSARFPSLAGKRVFITGGGSGIGASLVEAFLRQDARVAFIDIAREAAEGLLQHLRQQGLASPWFRACDVSDVHRLQETIAAAAAELGDFNVLVNNVANDDRRDTLAITPEYWDQRMAINQRPAFFAIQSVLPAMQAMGGGSIINLGSTGWKARTPGYPPYATAKASVMGLTRGLAKELGAHRIRINVVSPGWVMTERQLANWAVPDMEAQIARMQCLPDPLHAPDIASMVLFLASDDARGCTAQEFIVDAGWT